jgi:tetratricopeptide (TPR) repeat protein
MRRVSSLPLLCVLCVLLAPLAAAADAPRPDDAGGSIGDYYSALEAAGLVDVDTGTREALVAEVGAAEKLLRDGAALEAAVALYGIVESPRFEVFADFVEYHNAEYYLGVALATAGAYGSALDYLERVMERGPSTLYFAPAHRRAVDIAIETREFAEVLSRLTALKLNEPIPPGPAGERTYLEARIAYQAGKLREAEGLLARISTRSRLYSSALYLRGVIRTRRGDFPGGAEAFCEIVDTPDDDKFTFVVDDRYFTIKDLARLGLGRIAHEQGEYDDAYYHYFQIPSDSDRLEEALFEAAWSMYQKRELGTARDLVNEFTRVFPTSPLMPEARLLAGYVDLADCQFDDAQAYYDRLVADLEPIVAELDRIRRDPEARRALFSRALDRRRAERADPGQRLDRPAGDATDQVLGLLRLDPGFVRLHEAVAGLRGAAGDAPHVVRAWSSLGRRMGQQGVAATTGETSFEQDEAAAAAALLDDVRRLRQDARRARQELRRGLREKTLPEDAAAEEMARLDQLEREIADLEARAAAAARAAQDAVIAASAPQLAPMVAGDLDRARTLDQAARTLLDQLIAAADELSIRSLDTLHTDTKRVLDKARLGKIDAVIGQKRKLDIEVQDLASGRYPPELHGRLWEQGLIGDDEEFWPWQGEFWADEYEGWR